MFFFHYIKIAVEKYKKSAHSILHIDAKIKPELYCKNKVCAVLPKSIFKVKIQ